MKTPSILLAIIFFAGSVLAQGSLGNMALQNANAITITGGTMNGVVIGGTTPAAGTFTGIYMGGATNLFPALKRSSTELQVRLADDSGYAPIKASNVNADGIVTVNGGGINPPQSSYALFPYTGVGLGLASQLHIGFCVNGGGAPATEVWRMTSAGHFLAATDNTYDIGDSSHQVRDAFIGRSLILSAAATLVITSGTNQRAGDATLTAGSVVVNNATVTANTRVFLTRKTAAGTIGDLTYSVSAATSFTITSASGSDTSNVSFLLIEVP